MKSIFTLAFLVVTTLISHAAAIESRITITNLGFYDVLVEIDGKRYDDGGKNITIPYLSAGNHTLRIARLPGRARQEDRDAGGAGEKVLYNNPIAVRPQYHIDIVINRFDKVVVDEQSMAGKQYQPGGDSHYIDDGPMYMDASLYEVGCRPLSRQAFNSLLELMSGEISGTKRLELAKQVIDQNYVTAMQVKLLADMFTSDDRALDLARYAYPRTVNKNEFFVVYTRFLRNGSRAKLVDFIKGYRGA